MFYLFVILSVFLSGVATLPLKPENRSLGSANHTEKMTIRLTWDNVAPDGIVRKGVLINGEFGGPLLVAKQGDNVEFTVQNYMPFPTTVHFHGIPQIGTPWSDGVPSVSQRPIQPNETFIYNWTASEPGLYWYHSHAYSQVSDGLYGPIYVHPAENTDKHFHKISSDEHDVAQMNAAEATAKVLSLHDWTHFTSNEIMAIEKEANLDAYCVNSLLVNGKGSVYCPPQEDLNKWAVLQQSIMNSTQHVSDMGCLPPSVKSISEDLGFKVNMSAIPPGVISGCHATAGLTEVVEVNSEKGWAAINLIVTASESAPVFTIDEHELWLYAVDAQYIEPQLYTGIQTANGNRYSFFIKLDKEPKEYTIRIGNSGASQLISGYATLRYSNRNENTSASTPWIGYNGMNLTENWRVFADNAISPYPPIKPAMAANRTIKLDFGHEGFEWKWTGSGNGSLSLDNSKEPVLFAPNSALLATQKNLTFRTNLYEWVDIIIQVQRGTPPHPVHKHSTKFFLIGQGSGYFNYSSVADAQKVIPKSFNLENPAYLDSAMTPSGIPEEGWMAIRYQVTNPGAFLLHCHVQTHFAGGMGVVLLDAPEEIPPLPPYYADFNSVS